MHENETACRTYFHMKSFALRLVLKQRRKRTRKWPIAFKAAHRSFRFAIGLTGSFLISFFFSNVTFQTYKDASLMLRPFRQVTSTCIKRCALRGHWGTSTVEGRFVKVRQGSCMLLVLLLVTVSFFNFRSSLKIA